MTRALRPLLVALALAALLAPAHADYPFLETRPESISIGALEFSPPEPERRVLPNGMVVYLLPNHELPLFQATAHFKAGSIYEPAEKLGLASLTGVVMRTGGTEEKTGDELDQELELLAARVETAISRETGSASVSTLKKDIDTGLAIFADVLRRPAFREDKLELARKQMLEAIRRQNDDPSEVARREFSRLLYGADNPWGRVPTVETVNAVRRQDLVEFHRRFLHPNNVILAASGDFEPDELMAKIEKLFGDWPKQEVRFPEVAPVPSELEPTVYLIRRDAPQTIVRWGHFGMRRHSEDRPAVEVMNFILGAGDFSSRLVREIRTNRGLAYQVGGLVTEGTDRGVFVALALTKTESTAETAGLIRQVIRDMIEKAPTEEEVRLAKEALLNSYVFEYESPESLVNAHASNELLGYPRDYLRTYPERIQKVTVADVYAAARKYLHPDRMMLLVVGGPPESEGLSTFGPVKEIQLEGAPEGSP